MNSDFTMASCRFLIKCCSAGVPTGETKESVCELIGVHLAALNEMKQRKGKAALVIELERLAKGFKDPRIDPLMEEAQRIFEGTIAPKAEPELLVIEDELPRELTGTSGDPEDIFS